MLLLHTQISDLPILIIEIYFKHGWRVFAQAE